MRKVILATAVACLLLLVPAAAATTVNVDLSKLGFVPSATTIQAGDTVMWTNKDTENHQVVCKACPFTSPVLKAGETYSYQFNKVGKFTTEDPLNGNKKGTVTVKAVPTSVTLAASPTVATYGGSTTLSGTLSTQQAGQKVDILSQPCDAKNAKSIATVTTTSGGAFTYTAQPDMNTAFQARTLPAAGSTVSSTATFSVRPKVTLSRLARGRHVTRFSVRLAASSSFVGHAVVFQRYNRVTATWASVRTVLLRAAFPSALPLPGTTVSSSTFRVRIKRHVRVRMILPPAQAGSCYVAARSNVNSS